MPNIITKPLTKEQINQTIDTENCQLCVVIPVELNDLIYGSDIDNLNDLAQEKIIGPGNAMLTDISYQVAGAIAPDETASNSWMSGTILLRVTAVLEPED